MIKRKPQPKTLSSSDSGFTIIESLIGIVVVAILMAAISPVLVMSTAIRVQSRRVEKATQAANTFIDGVRTGSIPPPTANQIPLDPATAEDPRDLAQNLISSVNMEAPSTATDPDLYLFTKDGNICHLNPESEEIDQPDCTSESPFDEFYIQARQIIVRESQASDGYRLAVRVYRGDVDFDKPLLANIQEDVAGNTSTKTASVVTEGLGNKQAPAVERTADIASIGTSFEALCQRFGIAPDNDGNGQSCN
ncbi:hormogonium polysaccharide secretion pseudopilin HpsB [Anabaena sp. CCY 0017]|uniref:hormogonium polysaccharide secretion pseudopilin HpsB n=1 Tax=Anabaena sp. CCY 0017 TaxID=3103866 RepID=UPI0039C71027